MHWPFSRIKRLSSSRRWRTRVGCLGRCCRSPRLRSRYVWPMLQKRLKLTLFRSQGYCLLDLAVEQRTLDLAETKPQDHVRRAPFSLDEGRLLTLFSCYRQSMPSAFATSVSPLATSHAPSALGLRLTARKWRRSDQRRSPPSRVSSSFLWYVMSHTNELYPPRSFADENPPQQLDDDHILNFSHALVESRRAMAEGLGAAIHRRCIK